MDHHGHEVFFEYRPDYDILFLIVQAPFKYLIEAKKNNKPIVQRLDGSWYFTVAGWRYPFLNLKAKIIRHLFTDFTIYQSEYSKYCSTKLLGIKKHDPSAIIYNGADLDIFSPLGETLTLRDNPDQKIFFTASAFRRTDQIVPLLKALKIYREKYGDNFKFLVAGNFSAKVKHIPKVWSHFKNVQFLGKIENKDLPCYERAADVFLFTHLNPPCPNNVIEAMACRLPICGVADGAMPELIEPGKNGLLIDTNDDAFWKSRTLNLKAFADNLDIIIKKQSEYSKKSYASAKERFSLDTMIEKYIDVINQLVAKKNMNFPRRYEFFTDRKGRAAFIAKIFEKELSQSSSILDVGCDCNTLKHLLGTKVTGVDLYGNPDYKIDFEKEKLARFKDGEFDMIICTEVLEHLENLYEMINEIFRVSSKYILISLPNCADFFSKISILFTGHIGKFYGLPIEKPDDRHRWFFSHTDIDKFFSEYSQRNNHKILRRFLLCNYSYTWRGALVRLFIKIFNVNSAGQSYWILLEKNNSQI